MSNTAQSAQSEHRLGPSLSLQDGVSPFLLGEFVLVRIPEPIQVDGHIVDEATAGTTALPPTSNGSSPQHFAFIHQVNFILESFVLEVYPILSFSGSGGALAGYNQMDDASKVTLLPLPALSLTHPTPEAFGAPLAFGSWTMFKDSWLNIVPRQFTMPTSRPFKRMEPPLVMHFSVLNRIDRYRKTLRLNMPTPDADFHPHPPPNDESGDKQGGSNPRRGRLGDAGGQTAPRETSVTSSPTLNGDGGGEKAAGAEGAGLEHLLVLEGVDEDAEGADATMRDELIMMARGDPMWMAELRKYLQEEEKEREQVQKERAVRLAHWREGIIVE